MFGHVRRTIFAGLVIIAGQLLAQSSGGFVRTGKMSSARSWHTSTLLPDGKVLLTGGVSADRRTALASAELYDPTTGTFVPTGSMKIARWWHAATRMADGRILITGGIHAGTEAEIYDPSTGAFTVAGRMTAARAFHGAILLSSGKVLITGGQPLDGTAAYQASAEIFDPESGLFTATVDMTAARYNHRIMELTDGSVFIAPGSDGADYTTAEVYDPRIDIFRSLPFNPPNLGFVTATSDLLPSGRVLLTLQVAECDYSTSFARFYDPGTSTFSAAPNMNSNHCQQASTQLADGNVLIVGSVNDGTGGLPVAEIYDTRSDRFSVVGHVGYARFNPRLTLLNSGKVLVTGSAGGIGVEDANAELYESVVSAPALRLLALHDGQPAILHANTHALVTSDHPAHAGEPLEIYGTGLVAGSRIAPQVTIGGRLAEILYFGDAPGFPDLNQINVRVPRETKKGIVQVQIIYLGRSSNAVSLPFE